jgi:predicted metal-binding membrane protein
LACTLQFAGVYTTCWCASAVISHGARAYVVMLFTEEEIQNWWKPLVGFTAFARSGFTLHQR